MDKCDFIQVKCVSIYSKGVKLEIFKVNINKINPSLDEGYFKKEFNYIQTYSNTPNQYNDYFNLFFLNQMQMYLYLTIRKSIL